MPIREKKEEEKLPRPEVILDFIFEEGLFFISVRNISDVPAYKVSTRFSRRFRGVGGTKRVSDLPLFRNIEFLAPRKEIRTFLDTSASYFKREEPTQISVRIAYQDSAGKTYKTTIQHDLEIYREIGYVKKGETGT